jgi:hypothetical protein
MPDPITLKLGDFTFSSYEIPEKITFGGDQHLVTHELVGGVRVVDAMGRSDAPLQWSGLMLGQNALNRARYLDYLRVTGLALPLTWSELSYQVVVSSFTADFERSYKIPYRINCTVVSDVAAPIKGSAPDGFDQAVRNDMNSANTLGGLIGDGPLSAALGGLNTAIGAVSNFAKATQSVINGVVGPLAAVQSRVGLLIGSVGNVVTNISTVGGILPNSPIASAASRLNGQVAAMTQLPQLYNLQSVVGRMAGNLGSIGSGAKTLVQAGGNLYSAAQQVYGDATAWTTLARANSLIDPVLSGVTNLKIPALPDGLGGILSS